MPAPQAQASGRRRCVYDVLCCLFSRVRVSVRVECSFHALNIPLLSSRSFSFFPTSQRARVRRPLPPSKAFATSLSRSPCLLGYQPWPARRDGPFSSGSMLLPAPRPLYTLSLSPRLPCSPNFCLYHHYHYHRLRVRLVSYPLLCSDSPPSRIAAARDSKRRPLVRLRSVLPATTRPQFPHSSFPVPILHSAPRSLRSSYRPDVDASRPVHEQGCDRLSRVLVPVPPIHLLPSPSLLLLDHPPVASCPAVSCRRVVSSYRASLPFPPLRPPTVSDTIRSRSRLPPPSYS